LLACEGDPRWHIRADVLAVLDDGWDIGIFHPPCTYLCSSGLHWNTRQFGHDASKATCLWLKGLPLLTPTTIVAPRFVTRGGKSRPRWDNQTDSGQNRLGPSADRWALRSLTYPGIADAMADQWGSVAAHNAMVGA